MGVRTAIKLSHEMTIKTLQDVLCATDEGQLLRHLVEAGNPLNFQTHIVNIKSCSGTWHARPKVKSATKVQLRKQHRSYPTIFPIFQPYQVPCLQFNVESINASLSQGQCLSLSVSRYTYYLCVCVWLSVSLSCVFCVCLWDLSMYALWPAQKRNHSSIQFFNQDTFWPLLNFRFVSLLQNLSKIIHIVQH